MGPDLAQAEILTYRWWETREEDKASQEGSDLHFKNTTLQVVLEGGVGVGGLLTRRLGSKGVYLHDGRAQWGG